MVKLKKTKAFWASKLYGMRALLRLKYYKVRKISGQTGARTRDLQDTVLTLYRLS